ncbi:MAG TPA: hypothetical protein VGC36_15035 [Rhizomicrobium sp.]
MPDPTRPAGHPNSGYTALLNGVLVAAAKQRSCERIYNVANGTVQKLFIGRLILVCFVMRKLAFDPTPESSTASLRKRYKSMWGRIRDRHFIDNNFLCDICCNDRGRRDWLDAHEVYSFLQPDRIRLDRIIFVCKLCHEAIHLERTRRAARKKWVAEVEAHYCKVNEITSKELEHDFRVVMKRTNELRTLYSRKSPRMDYGDYQAEADLCERRKRKKRDDDSDDSEMYPDHECPWDVGHAD